MLNFFEALNAGRLAVISLISVVGGSLEIIFRPMSVGFTLLSYYFNLFLLQIGLPEITLPDLSVDTMLQRGAWTVAILAGGVSILTGILNGVKKWKELFPKCEDKTKNKNE